MATDERLASFDAVLSCPHEIDHDRVILKVDHSKEGNALAQLHARLSSLEASPAPVSEYAATRDQLFEAASDQSLSDAAVRQLCLAKLGPITSGVREWASAEITAKGGQ